MPLDEHRNAVWWAPWPADHRKGGSGSASAASWMSWSTVWRPSGVVIPFEAASGTSKTKTFWAGIPAEPAASSAAGNSGALVNNALHCVAPSCSPSDSALCKGLMGKDTPFRRCAAHETVKVSIYSKHHSAFALMLCVLDASMG